MARQLFSDSRVDYLLPGTVGASQGDVIAVTSAVAGLTLGFQAGGGGGGGLTQSEVYGETGNVPNAIYQLPALASAAVGDVMTVVNGQVELAALDFLTEPELYGAGQPYLLPVLSAATNGQVATVVGGALAFANAPAPALTQQQMYGAGPVYELPPLGADNQIMTVAGGAVQYSTYTGLQADDLWLGDPNYKLPDIAGAPIGATLQANNADSLQFALNPSVVLPVTLYGGPSLDNPNPPYVLAPISTASEGDVFSRVAPANSDWVALQPGVVASDLWANPAAPAKIPDFTGKAANDMFAYSGGGATVWNPPPPSIDASDLWADPQTPVTSNYKLPALGVATTVLAVSGTPNTLEYIAPTTAGTTTVTATFTSQFAGASTAQTILFSKTGKTIVCTMTSGNPIYTDGSTGAELNTVTFVPDSLPALAGYLPANPGLVTLGIMILQEVATGDLFSGYLTINPNNGVITWTSFGTAPTDPNTYLPGPEEDSSSFFGTWTTA